jgi:hypothetical protein
LTQTSRDRPEETGKNGRSKINEIFNDPFDDCGVVLRARIKKTSHEKMTDGRRSGHRRVSKGVDEKRRRNGTTDWRSIRVPGWRRVAAPGLRARKDRASRPKVGKAKGESPKGKPLAGDSRETTKRRVGKVGFGRAVGGAGGTGGTGGCPVGCPGGRDGPRGVRVGSKSPGSKTGGREIRKRGARGGSFPGFFPGPAGRFGALKVRGASGIVKASGREAFSAGKASKSVIRDVFPGPGSLSGRPVSTGMGCRGRFSVSFDFFPARPGGLKAFFGSFLVLGGPFGPFFDPVSIRFRPVSAGFGRFRPVAPGVPRGPFVFPGSPGLRGASGGGGHPGAPGVARPASVRRPGRPGPDFGEKRGAAFSVTPKIDHFGSLRKSGRAGLWAGGSGDFSRAAKML